MKTQGSHLEHRISTILLAIAFLSTSQAHAHPIVQYWENGGIDTAGLVLEPKVSYLNTSTNYDSSSHAYSLANSANIIRLYLDLRANYGITENFSIFGRLSAISENVNNPFQKDISAFGLSDQLLGASYRALHTSEGFNLRLQFDATLPAYKNGDALSNGKAYLGDESIDFNTGIFVETPVQWISSHLFAEAGGGYLYRSKGYSSAVPLMFALKHKVRQRGLIYEIGTRGQVSLKTDTTSTTPFGLGQALQESNRGAAGSVLIDGINPSWWVVQGKLGYQLSPQTAYHLSAAIPYTGTNAPGGLQVSLEASFYFSPNPTDTPEGYSSQRRNLSPPKEFATYDLNAKIISLNDQLYLVKIDQGSSDGVERGQTFDIFNQSKLIARTRVVSVKDSEAALNVVEYYQDQSIETSFTARRLVQ